MWNKLSKEGKEKYKILITNFASLSEAFSQKTETGEENDVVEFVAPIVNSKFQETVFQKAFDAVAEDIANTSYDASLKIDDNHKYLVGIKSFGIHSGDQKIAQFKANSELDGWNEILRMIKSNAQDKKDKSSADRINEPLYMELAKKISRLRNERIESSKAQIKGFNAEDVNVKAVYHVLMPSKKGEEPKIFVGETDYTPINLESLVVTGSTTKANPTNFKFEDGNHKYKYTAADSQLLMTFNNKDIVVDTWSVNYVEDPFMIFENLQDIIEQSKFDEWTNVIESSVSWMIADENGHVEESSGFNGFDGAPKLAKRNNYREKRIAKIQRDFENSISSNDMKVIISKLENILLNDWTTKEDKKKMKKIREELMEFAKKIENKKLELELEKMVYRPISEMYIPIKGSRKFHDSNPDFFGKGIGTFKDGTNKLSLPKEERSFKLEFLPSGNVITAYVNQDDGKGIQSTGNQGILGDWILRGVFQLDKRELLTGKRLNEMEINAIRLSKFKDHERGVGLEFIWIDSENPPEDAIGWIARS